VETALALGQSEVALDALGHDENTNSKPSLLMLRAQAQEQAGDREAAAADYLAVYYRYPLSPQARDAVRKILWLQRVMREKFPAVPLEQQTARAAALYDAHQLHEARQEYLKLLPALANTDRERAELRIAECRAETGAGAPALALLKLNDPALDAERLYELAQIYRNEKKESPMLEAIDQAVARAPHSAPAEQALFLGGNYYWVQLDLDRAAQFYRRLVDASPNDQNAPVAHWRIVWQAYRERRPEAASLLQEHLRRYSNSPYIGDALYWLGRTAERDGDAALARAYFGKLWERYPQTYFGGRAADRLKVLGPGPRATAEVLDFVPPPPPARSVDEDTPPAAEARVERAQALHSLGFDSTEELEYRAAYAETNAPGLLLDAARAAAEAHRYSVAFVTIRQIVPQLESHPIPDVPKDVWRAAYPLPYQTDFERLAPQAGLDPMQVAGLVRQESGFERDAVSRAGAIGLMQLLPKTAKKLARRLKLRYARNQLFDPDYNLRLGTVYFADLRNYLGSTEAALAAYNAGDDRVAGWKAGRNFEEPAEFVESIPFTETREYVQIVMRNGAIYRALYGGSQ
jgi:soluble lytic murein transglycosylase